MTRDEAIEIEKKKLARYHSHIDGINTIAAANIDALIELGLLKVDEPIYDRTIKLSRFVDRINWGGSINSFDILLDKYGLKIVEK